MLNKLQNNRGFTLIELMMVMVLLGIISNMGFMAYRDIIARSYDIMALTDAKNLVTVVTNSFIAVDMVNYDHEPEDGSLVGISIRLSPGVKAKIIDTSGGVGAGDVEAYLWHEKGTPATVFLFSGGKREYYCSMDEAVGLYYFPDPIFFN